jgi:hypothetical protein
MSLIIDAHAHFFPDPLHPLVPEAAQSTYDEFRKRGRAWIKPFTGTLHRAQAFLRHLPESARWPFDELGGIAPLPGLFFESTVEDLLEAMDEASVSRAVVIAHPPLISNEFLLERCREQPRLIPVVNIPAGTPQPGSALKHFVEQGAKALKIHPASDGEGVTSAHYAVLLKTADELGLPVILHTGCFYAHLIYKEPELGHAQHFAPWFESFPNLRFILAHMNFHEPSVALDLVEKHPNVFVDTSWQPAEVIGEAVRRVGAERVLFGTDWPFVGNNVNIGLARIHDCIQAGTLTEEQSKLILGVNAAKIFGISI